jgi:hypothetical protein
LIERLITYKNSKYLVLLKICIFDFSSQLCGDYVFRYKSLDIFEELSKLATINFGVFDAMRNEGFIDLT